MRGDETGATRLGQRLAGLALALLAAGVLTLATFMPKLHSQTIALAQIPSNRLVDGWEGAALIACAALAALGAGLGLRWTRWGWLACSAGVIAFALVIYASTGARLLYDKGGALEGPIYVEPGIGLLTAGVGALMAIGAGLTVALSRETSHRRALASAHLARR